MQQFVERGRPVARDVPVRGVLEVEGADAVAGGVAERGHRLPVQLLAGVLQRPGHDGFRGPRQPDPDERAGGEASGVIVDLDPAPVHAAGQQRQPGPGELGDPGQFLGVHREQRNPARDGRLQDGADGRAGRAPLDAAHQAGAEPAPRVRASTAHAATVPAASAGTSGRNVTGPPRWQRAAVPPIPSWCRRWRRLARTGPPGYGAATVKLFHPGNPNRSEEAQRLYAAFEVWYTLVDFAAAALFVVGSVLFLWERTTTTGTVLFIVGSVCFALKPTLRLVRELRMARIGDTEDLAQRAE